VNKKANILLALLLVACVGVVGYQAYSGKYVTWSHESPTKAMATPDRDPNLYLGDTLTESGVVVRAMADDSKLNQEAVYESTRIDSNDVDLLSIFVEPIDIAIWGDGFEVVISAKSGKLDIIGDPNRYTEAARVFWCEAAPEAVYGIFSADNKAIRQLCESGRVCDVMGHSWRDGNLSLAYCPNTFSRTCTMCGKRETQSLTEWK
jgi:hypothetical protein